MSVKSLEDFSRFYQSISKEDRCVEAAVAFLVVVAVYLFSNSGIDFDRFQGFLKRFGDAFSFADVFFNYEEAFRDFVKGLMKVYRR